MPSKLAMIIDRASATACVVCPLSVADNRLQLVTTETGLAALDRKTIHRIRRLIPSEYDVRQIEIRAVSDSDFERRMEKVYGGCSEPDDECSSDLGVSRVVILANLHDAAAVKEELLRTCGWIDAWDSAARTNLVEAIISTIARYGQARIMITEKGDIVLESCE
jgi:hypothetical protein